MDFVFVSNKKGPGITPGPQRQDIDWRLTHQCIGDLVRNAIGLGPVAVLVALALKIHIDILRLDATDGIHHQLADLLVKLVLAQTCIVVGIAIKSSAACCKAVITSFMDLEVSVTCATAVSSSSSTSTEVIS